MSTTLREFIDQHFDVEELRTLCFDLGVKYDDLRGEGRSAKIRELVALMERLTRLGDMVELVQQARPEAFKAANVTVKRELTPAGVRWWRWDWLHVGLLALILLLLGIVILQVAPWGDRGASTTVTPPSVADARTPSATPAPTTPTRLATPTPSLTAAPPTLTPSITPTPTSGVSSADVVIVEFDARGAANPQVIAFRLETDLRNRLREAGLDDVVVKVISDPVRDEDQARTLAAQAGSEALIWGWYDQAGIQVRILLTNAGRTGGDLPATDIVPLEHRDDPRELAILVEEDLANNVSFLSFFVIGHLHYQANEYQAGYAAFDAAMSNIPANATLQDRALVPFFSARQLEAQGSDDVTAIVCEYARAIELNPDFVEAYNNLGIVLTQHFTPFSPGGGGGVILPDEAYVCLEKIGFSGQRWSPVRLFDQALELQPGWAVAEYNRGAFEWQDNPNVEQLKTQFEMILQRDPSIPGVHIILGNIAFDEDDLETAAARFSSALELLRDSAPLHVNLGQVYLRQGQREQAETEFQAALAIDDKNAEAHLALANLYLQQEETASALAHLEQIPALEENDGVSLNSPAAMAEILRSHLYLNDGELGRSISALERLTLLSFWTPLEDYLLGLLYTLDNDAAAAAERWDEMPWFCDSQSLAFQVADNEISAVAWCELVERCSHSTDDHFSQWGTAQNQCLPTDLEARIEAVYDAFRQRLAHRLYFRRELYPTGAACPYVFTYDATHQAWRWDNTILYNLVGREREALQRRHLTRFDGRLLIREVEPEVSYIDQLYIIIEDRAGQEIVLTAPLTALQAADGRYLVLYPGDEILLAFEGYQSIRPPRQVWVLAKGYYVPLLDDAVD